MDVFYCDHLPVPLPAGHRFPMGKYAGLRHALQAERVLDADELHPAPRAPLAAVLAVHAREYVEAFVTGALERAALSRLGFPWSHELVARSLASVGGTLAAARSALEHGIAGTLAGGTHHAHATFGSGWCALNDIAVAARAVLDEGRCARVLVVDVDVHQGDGTAAIFGAEPRVFTLSLHGERNFPLQKQTSDLDVALPDGTRDERYLDELERALRLAFEHARPELVFVQAGVDPLEQDRLGRLALSHAGLAERDRAILGACLEAGVPAVLTLGGGYADPVVASIAAHVNTYRVARELFGPSRSRARAEEGISEPDI